MASSRIMIVEDDQTLLGVLKYNLAKEGYDVVTATDGAQALEVARSGKPDLVVLDVMLPKLDGFEVCRILRREMIVPILMLTAKTEEVDKVVGLELGADDYMTKPFSIRELLARIRAMLRRTEMMMREIASSQEAGPSAIKAGRLEIDPARHQACLGGSPLDLSRKEFDLLAFLASNRSRVFSRDYLLEKVWGYDYAGDTRTVDVHIRWLRQKIEVDPAHPRHLVTVRGVGYKFEG
ncbi:MAG: response regulator transcription factor [Chloroflexi bacterium]|nr:response regulator transcription factor [Chloroflexota bacterium]